jgi:hypothetical protein
MNRQETDVLKDSQPLVYTKGGDSKERTKMIKMIAIVQRIGLRTRSPVGWERGEAFIFDREISMH